MSDEEFNEDLYKYLPPEGKCWKYIGDCPCGGQDADHFYNDEEWELVDV